MNWQLKFLGFLFFEKIVLYNTKFYGIIFFVPVPRVHRDKSPLMGGGPLCRPDGPRAGRSMEQIPHLGA
jgi:hypothetical protein